MDNEKRRELVFNAIKDSKGPISATSLAKKYGVSRQVIVGDIALLRATGEQIIATNSGYILDSSSESLKPSVKIKVSHKAEDVYDEICTIVDEGARIRDISVEHPIYGSINVPLSITNRSEARNYVEKLMESRSGHLAVVTGHVHYHMIEADDEITLIRVQKALNDKGYMVK